MTDIKWIAAVGVLLLVAIWLLSDALPDGLREPVRRKLMWAAALAIASALAVAGVISAPWWVGIGAGAAVLAGTGAAATLKKLGTHQELRCGDYGTCGAWIDGAICLGTQCGGE